jgi:UDP-2,3-diacylglucosamine pyrophosphatase LpxH
MWYSMRTVIFSDSHLTNRFEKDKFEFLADLIQKADQVIINGDFWDGEIIYFKQFINSKWKKLFPLLQKKTIYLYGNHDAIALSGKDVMKFCRVAKREHRLKVGKYTLVITHGDEIVPLEFAHNLFHNSGILSTPLQFLYPWAERMCIKLFGKYFFRIYRVFNRKMKRYAKIHLKKNEILVCGHTHCAEFSVEKQFINEGVVRHGLAQYLLVEDDAFRLIDTTY